MKQISRNITLTRNGKTYQCQFARLYMKADDLSQNVLLQQGDVLNVPDRQFNKVFVLGETTVVLLVLVAVQFLVEAILQDPAVYI